VWAAAGPGTTGWTASLVYGSLTVPLAPAGGGWQASKGRWELSFTVPANVPEEVYSLVLASDSTSADTTRHSVKVLPSYRGDYYFAQISDTHLPEHATSSNGTINTADTTGMGDFDAVIEDLNVIHPEFVIHTGDLVNEGELEEYLGMYEMGRAQGMLGHLDAPVWVSTGNHDIGGWGATPPPDGTSRKNWWRYFGWKWLENPPAGDPYHSQDFTFDYGPLHVIGLEAYINNGSYDHYRQDIWGAQSFTTEQLAWLKADIAAQPPGTHKLLFYHYDFGGTTGTGGAGANFSQINPDSLHIDGDIWGHNHVIAENKNRARTAVPFDLGLQSVIDYRAFRIFRVHDGVMSPGPMHHAGGISSTPTDSMAVAWSGPNDGSRSALGVTIINRYGETWDHARLRFVMADHDSDFTATGGTIGEVIRQGGLADVYVDCVIPASATSAVTVQATTSLASVTPSAPVAFGIRSLGPNPFAAGSGPLVLRCALPVAGAARMEVFDTSGRRIVSLFDRTLSAGEHDVTWDGRDAGGAIAPPGVYLVRLAAGGRVASRRVALVR